MKKVVFSSCLLLLLAGFYLTSCKKNFEWNKVKAIEGEAEWALPIVNSKVYMSQVLQQLDKNGILSSNEQGVLHFIYEVSHDSIIRAKDFLHIDGQSAERSHQIDNPAPGMVLPEFAFSFDENIDVDTTNIKIIEGVVESGQLNFSVWHDITNGVNLRVEVTAHEIFLPNGDSLHVILQNTDENHLDLTLYLENCLLSRGDGSILNQLGFTFTFYVQLQGDETPIYNTHLSIEMTELIIKEINAFLGKITENFDLSTPFDLLTKQRWLQSSTMTFFQPLLTIYTRNTFDIPIDFYVDDARFIGGGEQRSLVVNPPLHIAFPSGTHIQRPNDNIPKLYLDTRFDTFNAIGSIVFNEPGFGAGPIIVSDTSSIGMKISADLPLDLLVENAFYRDTMEFHLDRTFEDFEGIESIDFRVQFTNGLPIHLRSQVYAYNSGIQQTIDSLFESQEILIGSYDGNPQPSQPIKVNITHNRVKEFVKADYIILNFQLITDENQVQLRENQFINTEICVKVNISAEDFNL